MRDDLGEPKVDVLLAVLPFAGLEHPSLGVSLLKGHALQLGLTARVCYLNFQLAESMGQDLYEALELGGPTGGPVQRHSTEALIGEWFFADLVFERCPPPEEYIGKFVLPEPERAPFRERILEARAKNRRYIERCVKEILRYRPTVVGLTSTFDQTCACLAVARRLKESPDPPIIVMGGANCEGEMGFQLARSFPCLDFVCTGEGDEPFPALLRRIFWGEGIERIPGLVQAAGPWTTPAAFKNLDSLPLPDFEDYFEDLSKSSLGNSVRPEVLFESSRGCWWGAKQHCTFCGLNGNTMAFRSKSSEKVIAELREISTRYGIHRIQFVDNILDMNYFRTFLPQLIESELNLDLFYDTKANLRLEHLRLLRDARVRSILPGIESFSNTILGMMRKGSTGAQNIQLLRWCKEFGIKPIWSFLYGFPGEPPEEYSRMVELVPLLVHLQPPSYCIPIQLDRFSPYFNHPEQWGVTNVRPTEAYRHIFPLRADAIHNLAYFFDFDFQDQREPLEYAAPLISQVGQWSQLDSMADLEERPRLDLYRSEAALIVRDSRPCATQPLHVLDGLAAEVYLLCDAVQIEKGLVRKFSAVASSGEIHRVLEDLIAGRLMMEIQGQYISLAVQRNRPIENYSVGEEDSAGVPRASSQLVQL